MNSSARPTAFYNVILWKMEAGSILYSTCKILSERRDKILMDILFTIFSHNIMKPVARKPESDWMFLRTFWDNRTNYKNKNPTQNSLSPKKRHISLTFLGDFWWFLVIGLFCLYEGFFFPLLDIHSNKLI